jgi:hypothetical protein
VTTSITGAIEIATAIHGFRPGHVTRGQLRTVLLDNLRIETLVQLGGLSEVLVRLAAVRVDLLLASPEALAACVARVAAGEPLTARDLGIEYGALLAEAGTANASRVERLAGHEH